MNDVLKIVSHTVLYAAKPIAVMFCIMLSFSVRAQTKDTSSYPLMEVIIEHHKQEVLQPSKKNVEMDSTVLSRYSASSLADMLAAQSTIHIKSYGNGNIATTSFRGGNASHTALLWNGLNIQNAMLGQFDLSIVPTLFFDNVNLEYGGGSALWGSGAIGGSIHLENKLAFDRGFKTKLQMSLGSFDTKKIAATVLLSYKKIASSTRIYYNSSKNDYSYKDTIDKENPNKKITHADYTMKGLMQEVSFIPFAWQKINVRLWYNLANRNLPSYTSYISKQSQEDENLKLNADWNYNRRKLNSTLRFAYFKDKLNYTDSISQIYSKTTVNTVIGESDNIYTHHNHTFNFGANYTQYQSHMPVTVKRYNGEEHDSLTQHLQTKFALFVAYRVSLFKSKLNYNIAVRKEFTNQTVIPFTGNTGIRYQLIKPLALKINANRSYRQPTLNDLYWPQGGNLSLKPEDSYEVDGGAEFKKTKNNFSFLVEGTFFNRHTTNWIIWLPTSSNYFSPRNIAKVYSRGAETRTELGYTKKDIGVKLILNTAYVLSTNQTATNENDNAVGRQLIYTPRYTGQSTLIGTYKTVTVLFSQSYTGYRFTSTDNTTWLNPYYIANLKLKYSYAFNSVAVEFFGGINNLFNKNYTVVANRPMALRNYEAGLSLQYIKKTNKI
ncbi:MAG: TonB-dependent receptor [Bacteroidota bacterium]